MNLHVHQSALCTEEARVAADRARQFHEMTMAGLDVVHKLGAALLRASRQ